MPSGSVFEIAAKWTFGPTGNANAVGGTGHLGSTGSGTAILMAGLGWNLTAYIETDAGATCSYQILTARTATGPTQVLSSGTLSTTALNVFQWNGPVAYVFPRVKTLNSTANLVTVEVFGN